MRDAKIGAIFTRNGITGSDKLKAAEKVINDYHCKNNQLTIVFDDDDWNYLKEKPRNFALLFFVKIDFYITYQSSKINNHIDIENYFK